VPPAAETPVEPPNAAPAATPPADSGTDAKPPQ
jgi:hypothetical protein